RDEVHAARVRDAARQLLGLGGVADDLQAVAQPLHRGARDEHAALQRVHWLSVRAAGERRKQPVLRHGPLRPGVQEQERSGAVGVLRLAGLDAALAEERRLLVARYAGDRQLGPEVLG